MKILLTGKPGVGKSTLIQKITKKLSLPLRGIIAKEIRNSEGQREGFEAYNLSGESVLFAHVHKIHSTHVIGNKYHVDINAINTFVVPEISPTSALSAKNEVVIIDEIGRMQALSAEFLETTRQLLDSKTSFLGTIVLDPEPWSLPIKKHPELILVEVTEKNRRQLSQSIVEIFDHLPELQTLNERQQQYVIELLRTYFSGRQYIQIGKLMRNALSYLTFHKISKMKTEDASQTYVIRGNTGNHMTHRSKNGDWTCDCDLFHGTGHYRNKPGVCSHIQSAELFHLR